MERHRYTVVAAVDLSDFAPAVVETAIDHALRHEPAHVHFVKVESVRRATRCAGIEERMRVSERNLRDLVGEVLGDFMAAHGPARLGASVHVRCGHPVEEISDLIDESRADVLIVGKQGWGRTRGALLGSVASRLLRIAPCSVLTVQPPDFEPRDRLEEACPECASVRQRSGGDSWFCERHRADDDKIRIHNVIPVASLSLRPTQVF